MAAANEHMRSARLARGLSRPELADAIAAHVADATGAEPAIDANYVAKLERGAVRWPGRAYRAALRHVLGAATDADLGLYPSRRSTPPMPAPARHGGAAEDCDQVRIAADGVEVSAAEFVAPNEVREKLPSKDADRVEHALKRYTKLVSFIQGNSSWPPRER